MRKNLPVTQREIALREGMSIVSKTDKKGLITYVNPEFMEISGFKEDELLGAPHNIIRHPDMPAEAFHDLWETLKAGRPWIGMVKNRCKNGDYYWVEAHATPIFESGNVVGYMSVRRKATREQIESAEKLYRSVREKTISVKFAQGAANSGGIASWFAWWPRVSAQAKLLSMLIAMVVLAVVGAAPLWLGTTNAWMSAKGAALTLLIGTPIIAALLYAWSRRVLSPMRRITEVMRLIAEGRYENTLDIRRDDEVGRVLQSLESMQVKLGFDVADAKRISDEALRIRTALDQSSACIRVCDNDGRIIYVNKAMVSVLKSIENALREKHPDFSADRIIGTSVGVFYANPGEALANLAKLTTTREAELVIGDREFALTTSPIFSAQGERLGSIGQWQDRTEALAAQREIKRIVEAATEGDFSQRINASTMSGFNRDVSEGLNKITQLADTGIADVARVINALSKGALTERIEADYRGAFDNLKRDTNGSIDQLSKIIVDIKAAVDAINTAAKEIASGNSDLSARTETQASSLQETASSMEELTSAVKQNAENARMANQLAIGASDVAAKGGQVVSEVVRTMGDINDSSKKISDIISVIDGIAFQTNILALNAAVEAARAGEQGRGFAVVATEVRNLAQRSASAAKEIKSLISSSVERVENGSKLVDEAGRTMEEIVGSVRRVTDIMSEITAASQEQSSGIEQVNQAITQMDEVTQQNAALVEEAAAAAESLEEQAQMLSRAVEMFKLSSKPGLDARPLERRGGDRAKNVARLPSTKPQSPSTSNAGNSAHGSARAKVAGGKSAEDEWEQF